MQPARHRSTSEDGSEFWQPVRRTITRKSDGSFSKKCIAFVTNWSPRMSWLGLKRKKFPTGFSKEKVFRPRQKVLREVISPQVIRSSTNFIQSEFNRSPVSSFVRWHASTSFPIDSTKLSLLRWAAPPKPSPWGCRAKNQTHNLCVYPMDCAFLSSGSPDCQSSPCR